MGIIEWEFERTRGWRGLVGFIWGCGSGLDEKVAIAWYKMDCRFASRSQLWRFDGRERVRRERSVFDFWVRGVGVRDGGECMFGWGCEV